MPATTIPLRNATWFRLGAAAQNAGAPAQETNVVPWGEGDGTGAPKGAILVPERL